MLVVDSLSCSQVDRTTIVFACNETDGETSLICIAMHSWIPCRRTQVLEAINLVLAACHMTTILGVATDMLYRAIRSYYSSKGDSSEAAAATPEGAEQLAFLVPLDIKQAREYLQKIVQV